jgi:hypothetical protein
MQVRKMQKNYASGLKKILLDVKYQEFVLRKILRDRGYHTLHLYKFLSDCVEPKEDEPILKNF